jgi:L-fuculose-phosphate aldolase
LNMTNEELKIRLEQAYRILYMEGMADDTTRGHMTAKADDGTIYIKPWGMGFEEVTARDFLGMDSAGTITEGEGRLHSEILIHLEIYRRRKDVFSITHVHPLYAVLFSSLFRGRMYMIGQHSLHFGGHVPFYESAKLIHSQEQAAKLVDLLANGPMVLMRNHGIVVAGQSIEEAAIMTIDFEKAAREHLAVSPIGEPLEMSKEETEKMREVICTARQYAMLWNYYCRKINRMKNIIS